MNQTLENTQTLAGYVAGLGITAKVKPLEKIPSSAGEWAKQGWRITLKYQTRAMSFNFYGGGKVSTPSAIDGVWTMALESSSADLDFNEWCSEFGYSTDSRSAFATWRKVKDQAAKFAAFINSAATLEKLQDLSNEY